MSSTRSTSYVSPPARLAAFVRDFLPHQNVQLLFPLGSFFLLLGASYPWYKLPGVLTDFLWRWRTDTARAAHLVRDLDLLVGWEQWIPRILVQIAFFASLVLWSLPVRKVGTKFTGWIFLPVGAAIVGYPAFLIATANSRNAVIAQFLTSARTQPPVLNSWIPTVGRGLYFALSGLVILGVAGILERRKRVLLPVRFRGGEQQVDDEGSRDGKDVFTLVIGTAIWAAASGMFWLIPELLGKTIQWSGSFSIYEWLPALGGAVASATIAAFLFREETSQAIRGLLRNEPLREYAVAVAVPFAIGLGPRIFLKLFSVLPLSPRSSGGWSEILPGPFPQILLAFVIGLFEEFAVRGYLQKTLEKHLSLGKAIFLTGLLWALLPLGWGTTQSLPHGAYLEIPGISFSALAVARIVYSIPLGWLFARTRSIIPVTLMHGTIAVFHLGYGRDIQLNHPQLYLVELALWAFVGWYVMGERRYAVRSAHG